MNRSSRSTSRPPHERKTEPGRFGAALRSAAAGAARGVAASVELAAPYVPGGTVLSAAVRGAAGTLAARGRRRGAAPRRPQRARETCSRPPARCSRRPRAFNLQYLQLQENMQRESREFTALSNVMKVKHDSAKAAIHNIH